MDVEVIGAIKIKDGLFMGDEFSSQDLEFVVANKVTHVVNCASATIPNHWEPIGVLYLPFKWVDEDTQLILDHKNENISQIYNFIEDAVEKLESVLVVSTKGQSRCSTVIAAYLMKKYKWTLLKTLEFLNSRRPDLEIRTCFIQQLSQYETRLSTLGEGCKTTKWNEVYDKSNNCENEELLLRNTYLNSQMGPIAEFDLKNNKNYKTVIGFHDDNQIATEIIFEDGKEFVPVDSHKKYKALTSIIKSVKKKISRNLKAENERSFGKKNENTPKFTVTKGPIKQVKMVQAEKQSLLSDRQEKSADAFGSPYINNEDSEPKANDPYKRVTINSHKPKNDNEQKPPKINNFVINENKQTSGSQFMNMLKNGIQPKEEEKQKSSNITNIIQSPNINNIIILNQPSIHVMNSGAPLAKTTKKDIEPKRPSSCKPKENKLSEKEMIPFPKNQLTNVYKNDENSKEAIKIPLANNNQIRTSIEKSQTSHSIMSTYKNGPVK